MDENRPQSAEASGMKAFVMFVLVCFAVPLVATVVAILVLGLLRALGLDGDPGLGPAPNCTGIICW